MSRPIFTLQLVGLEDQIKSLNAMAREQVPFATALALTRVAQVAQARATYELRTKLDAPTDYALNSIFVDPATKRKPSAMIYVKGWGRVSTGKRKKRGKAQDEVLGHLFDGGQRIEKGLEYRLRRVGGVLPAGWAAVPGEGCPLDAHGNIPPGFINQIISYFKLNASSADYMSDKGRARFQNRAAKKVAGNVEYFISRGPGWWFGRRAWKHGRAQTLPPGIWMRVTYSLRSAVKPVIMFVKQPTYRQYIDLERIASDALTQNLGGEFEDAMKIALSTAGKLGPDSTRAERLADYRARSGGG